MDLRMRGSHYELVVLHTLTGSQICRTLDVMHYTFYMVDYSNPDRIGFSYAQEEVDPRAYGFKQRVFEYHDSRPGPSGRAVYHYFEIERR